jgi:hypothetical protein
MVFSNALPMVSDEPVSNTSTPCLATTKMALEFHPLFSTLGKSLAGVTMA